MLVMVITQSDQAMLCYVEAINGDVNFFFFVLLCMQRIKGGIEESYGWNFCNIKLL